MTNLEIVLLACTLVFSILLVCMAALAKNMKSQIKIMEDIERNDKGYIAKLENRIKELKQLNQ